MIKVSLNEILDAGDTLSEIMKQQFRGSLAFKIARMAREFNKEIETFNIEKQKIIEKYCEKDENGQLKIDDNGMVKVLDESKDTIVKEMDNLLETQVEINVDKLPLDALDEFNITPQQMVAIENFFE